ncbi:1-acyl-sn-glycerol-3-phosphate acyltransferase [Saccharospirillum impatiens]|uniref:1-acyl-sn-glycerol-3-phosphate acyltransferase n=1 Tax=Saccharospirillum impatiens TaxID=169438 RepID=UPI000410075E|nr:1-acyl-sn-glycerol-3-phosphate acyltransferase [Saccharospirillum impatiens]
MQNNNKALSGGGSLMRRVAIGLLRLLGWEVRPFPDVPKAIVVGGPHTSNWDGFLGITSGIALTLHARFMIKNNLFKGPFGWLLRKLGGIPVDRARAGGVVGQTVAELNLHDRIIVVMTPEGTRSNADKWKTGFHHIARQAGLPIVLATADYEKKQISFPLVLEPGDDLEADMERIYDCFSEVTPRHPDKLSRPVKVLWDQKQAVKRSADH